LHTAGDDQILGAAHDALRRKVHGLLRGTALAVDRRSRHFFGKACGEPAGTCNVTGLRTDGIDAAVDDVFDREGIEVVALKDFWKEVCAKVGGVNFGESTATSADGA